MTTDNEIKEQLNKLLTQKRRGVLDTEKKILHSYETDLWRDSVSYDFLKNNIQHYDEEIKLQTLALIAESNKSTLDFTPRELELIIMFLDYNLKEKLEFVPLIEVVLKRMKDSLRVMHRGLVNEKKFMVTCEKYRKELGLQTEADMDSVCFVKRYERQVETYCSAFKAIRNICIISPDANYHRRKSSLQILLLLRDYLDNEFKELPWNSEQAGNIFQSLIIDTYESNKEMAFKLLKSMDSSLLRLNEEDRVYTMVKVAMKLGNRMRPIDTITSVYLFKIAMLSPLIQNIVKTRFDVKECCNTKVDVVILQFVLLLLKKLEKSLILAKKNIAMTITQHSLYGYLFCLRSLLSECNLKDAGKEALWRDTIAKLISVCFELNQAVSVIVNNSSPEGHLPHNVMSQLANKKYDSLHEELVTPQMVLLCSWRTVKEVSLLFGLLVSKSSISDNNSSMELLEEEQIIRIGEHLVSVLTEAKHCGAFEQAHVGFRQICTRLWRLDRKSLRELPKAWLYQILIAITGLSEENSKLCATRRSAGVPFMVQALLSSEPRVYKYEKTATFGSVMKILLGFTELHDYYLEANIKHLMYDCTVFSEDKRIFETLKCNRHWVEGVKVQATEIKTHALNILRAIFRHSEFGEVVNTYVASGIIAAFKSYDGLTWAERNAATLLFSALIIRIFGVQRTKDHINLTIDNKLNFRLFFEKYPDLFPFILHELQIFVSINDTTIKSNIQLILLLLSRLYVTDTNANTNVQSKIDDVVNLISQCAKSPVFEIRKLAARTLVSFLTEKSMGNVTRNIIDFLVSAETKTLLNLTHGYMLQIIEIMRQFNPVECQTLDIDWSLFLNNTSWILRNLEKGNCEPACFPLAAAYVDVCHEVCKADCTIITDLHSTLQRLLSHLINERKLKEGPAEKMYKISAIKFIVFTAKYTLEGESVVSTSLLTKLNPLIDNSCESYIFAWSAVAEINNNLTVDSKLLRDQCTDMAYNSLRRIWANESTCKMSYTSELQDEIFDFLYNTLKQIQQNNCTDKEKEIEICRFVVREVRYNGSRHGHCKRHSYLRLLGKSYATLSLYNEELTVQCIKNVYLIFCDNVCTASSNVDSRASIFEVLFDLFPEYDRYQMLPDVHLQWWKTVLKLLVDNDSNVRHEASILVDKIPINFVLEENLPLRIFLEKFCRYFQDKNPIVACIVLYSWSISLFEEVDYEVDDPGVQPIFQVNKSSNNDFFEPVEFAKMCVEFLRKYFEPQVNRSLTKDFTIRIDSQHTFTIPEFNSVKTVIQRYNKDRIPNVKGELKDILSPTYKNKLLQFLAYKQYESI